MKTGRLNVLLPLAQKPFAQGSSADPCEAVAAARCVLPVVPMQAFPKATCVIAAIHLAMTSMPRAAFAQDPQPVSPPPGPVLPRTIDVDPTIVVHVESTSPVEIQQSNAGEWQRVCDSPCDRPLLVNGRYRIHGQGTVPSQEFSLTAGIRDSGRDTAT